jgi:hypothetical protein
MTNTRRHVVTKTTIFSPVVLEPTNGSPTSGRFTDGITYEVADRLIKPELFAEALAYKKAHPDDRVIFGSEIVASRRVVIQTSDTLDSLAGRWANAWQTGRSLISRGD